MLNYQGYFFFAVWGWSFHLKMGDFDDRTQWKISMDFRLNYFQTQIHQIRCWRSGICDYIHRCRAYQDIYIYIYMIYIYIYIMYVYIHDKYIYIYYMYVCVYIYVDIYIYIYTYVYYFVLYIYICI